MCLYVVKYTRDIIQNGRIVTNVGSWLLFFIFCSRLLQIIGLCLRRTLQRFVHYSPDSQLPLIIAGGNNIFKNVSAALPNSFDTFGEQTWCFNIKVTYEYLLFFQRRI
jgi:hypothetical protein